MIKSIIFAVLFAGLVAANQQAGEVISQSVPVLVQPPQSPIQVAAPQPAAIAGSQPVEVGVVPTAVHHHHDQNGVTSHVHGEHHAGETQHAGEHHPAEQPPTGASYYSPAGVIQVVGSGAEQQQAKPGQIFQGGVRSFEQYGHPESASIPANYKPFGSWGLYIGGNPADGYYTNYYKALGNSVEKQQQAQQAGEIKPSAALGGQQAAFAPILKQAGSSPYNGADYYPFAYSTSDFSSVQKVPVIGSGFDGQFAGQYQPAGYVIGGQQQAPVVGVPQVYSGSFEQLNQPSLSYSADSYASTKKLGQAAFAQREVKEPQQPYQHQQQAKGYLSRYAYVQYPQAAAPIAPQQPQQQQVVAYPVPVGSQIVGSQPGVDGAFSPYGIHAFTRYAVKPAVVQSPTDYQNYYYSVPAYKQQSQQNYPYQPFSFYGYPLSQLHYSGSLPSSGIQAGVGSPAPGQPIPSQYSSGIIPQPNPADQPIAPVYPSHQGIAHSAGPQESLASEKSESEDKTQAVNKPQNKRA